MKAYALTLCILAFLFFLRVLGQGLVAFFDVAFLPPMEEWYSGLVPYPILLPIQILILAIQVKMIRDVRAGLGFFVVPRPRAGVALRWFSYIYFFGMVLRYVVTMALYPERRWFVGTIPIFFHFVLAGYLYVYSHVLTRREVQG